METWNNGPRLLELHLDSLFRYDDGGRMVSTNEWAPRPAPRFVLLRGGAGVLWRFGADVPDGVVVALEALCCKEPAGKSKEPLLKEAYLEALARDRPIDEVRSGPACWFSGPARPRVTSGAREAVTVRDESAHLLQGKLAEWLPDIPHTQPMMAVVEDGRAVSVCASVRITDAAHAAGVETLAEHRRRGHARVAASAWASAVQAIGRVALYSTTWDNAASLGVARSLGLAQLGTEMWVT